MYMYRQNANLSDRVDCQFENKFNDIKCQSNEYNEFG